MKRVLILALVITTILAAACSKYKYESVAGDPLGTRIYTLSNGLKVYMSVNKDVPRLQTYIAVKVGGKNDPVESTGLAHYFEHLMFKGTQQFGTSDYAAEKPLLDEIESLFELYRKTTGQTERTAIYHRIDSISYEASKIAIPNEYDKLMATIGANGTNAYTSKDMTVYVENIPSNQVENWAKIQADRFRNPVIRGFHTELETIYEEKNMSLTKDNRKVNETIYAALFPNHPYGTQTVLGTQESLKNPSITNVRNYHKTYYVPNNMAICLSGDFDPDQMIATIDKYFGDMQPNENLPKLQFAPEQPITTPIEKEVFGLDRQNITLGWRLPNVLDPSNDVAQVAAAILSNGQAGLIDLNLNQQQKVLGAGSYFNFQPDYGMAVVAGYPKEGQTLDEVRTLLLEEVAKLRDGNFDEKLIEASINNFKASMMKLYEENDKRADLYVQSFIDGSNWADEVNQLDRIAKVTKADVVAWAQKNLTPDNYAVIYKRAGRDPNEQKIAAPKITPIVTNRDSQSAFLTAAKEASIESIEPVFVDFNKDMSIVELQPGLEMLYKKNETNGLFTLVYRFEIGTQSDPSLSLVFDYLGYLGTDKMTAEQIASEMYSIACSFQTKVGTNQSTIKIMGLNENMGRAMEIVEELIANAKPDEAILANTKADYLKSRTDSKLNQARNFSALRNYLYFGPDFVRKTVLTTPAVEALTSEQLLAKAREMMGKQHKVLYYGPQSDAEVKTVLAQHHKYADELQPVVATRPQFQRTDQNKVIMAQYDAKQLYYVQFSNRGEIFDIANDPEITLYNEYFGGGMSSIVFQEMREARGLAYSSSASVMQLGYADTNYGFTAFIATQNDKMKTAIEAFDEIINNMPESEAAFNVAKESLLARFRTERITKEKVLWSYLKVRDLGLTEDNSKQLFEKIQNMTLADVKATQQKWVKGRNYIYGILGDIKDLDHTYLKTLGPVQTVTQEEIFGY